MKPLSLKANERRLLVAVLAILGTWALLSWVIQPLWDRARDLRLQAETQTERLAAVSRLVQEGPAVERIFETLSPYLAYSDQQQAHQSFLAELETLSRDAGLQLNLKPRAGKPNPQQSKFEVELEVQGSQAQLLRFMDALLALPRLITVERIRIASLPAGENAVRANLVLGGMILSNPPGE